MGKHKQWRKEAKKFRRKRIRSKFAQERDELQRIEEERLQNCPHYQAWLKEQEALEAFQQEEEKRQADQRHYQWMLDEEAAQTTWREKQLRAAEAQEEKERQIMILKEKLKEEDRKKEEQLEREKKEKEEALLKQDTLKRVIYDYINGIVNDLPNELRQPSESNPGKDDCPFFSKVGACRFFERCSRNHVKPGISKVLLFQGLYHHFSLINHSTHSKEYDTDISLEYNTFETYKHYKEFFKDIVGEIKKIGKVVLVKVCKNSEPHLRGNMYIQFRTERNALKAYSSLYGRYYAGKQLTPIFVSIPSWKNALCGQQWNKKCYKGSLCNFLHVFSNPNGELSRYNELPLDSESPKNRSSSESPEERKSSKSNKRSSHGGRSRSVERRYRSRESSRSRDKCHSETRRDSNKKDRSDRRNTDSNKRYYDSDRRRRNHSSRRHSDDLEQKRSSNSNWGMSRDGSAPGWSSSSDDEIKETKMNKSSKRSRKRKRYKKSDYD